MIFMQAVLVALGLAVFAFLLWEPWVEGVNANATTLGEIYFDDPFLVYIYFSFTSVFVGLYYAYNLLSYVRHGEVYSQKSVCALRTIKYCALSFAGFIFAAVAFLMLFNSGEDDIAGGVAIGLFLILTASTFGIVAARLERSISKRIQTT